MKDQKPLLEAIKETKLKDGTKLRIKVATFEDPIFETGDQVYSVARIEESKSGNLWDMSIAIYREQMTQEELNDKCEEICADPIYFSSLLKTKAK